MRTGLASVLQNYLVATPETKSEHDVDPSRLPRHVAIIMDGNGRWAKRRMLPRHAGHRAGVKSVRMVVEQCARRVFEVLTLFAFSSENWGRPKEEVSQLMELFMGALRSEAKRLQKNRVRLRIIGERSAFSEKLQQRIAEAEQATAGNDGLLLQIAANYLAEKVKRGELEPQDIDERNLAAELSFAGQPDPDLFIRTGGEQRISNFILWQSAYSELSFSQKLWPDFDEEEFARVLADYAGRQRRFGKTGEQVAGA